MPRILLRSGRSPFDPVPPEQVIQQNLIATNTGNLLFSDAVHKMLSTPDTEIVPNRYKVDPSDADRINDEYDAFVVPLANAFRPSFTRHLDDLSALIEKLRIPVVVFGVGGQAGTDYGTDHLAPIEDKVRRFCSAVLERSPSIGVRGEFTERYLNGLGYSDVEVIGCPSMFMHGRELRVDRRTDTLDASARLAINVSYDSGNIPGSVIGDGLIDRLADAALRRHPDLLYMAQELQDLELLYWGDVSEAAGTSSAAPLTRTHPLLREERTRLYYDSSTWIDALRDRDFAFGTRIHGNVAALLAGTPAVVLCHDSRTLELCRYFDIPHRLVSDLADETDLAGLPARLYEEADFSAMSAGHGERFDRLVSFMDRHGLDHVHRPGGDGGAAFESELKRVDLHPGVGSWRGDDDGGLGYRLAWLRQANAQAKARQTASDKRVRELSAKVTALEKKAKETAGLVKSVERTAKRLEKLEAQVRSTPYLRLRRLAGRVLRRLGLRR
ncbi:polysaccharide pyruvyl transferase family protein [Nocardiopsis aegyptia]|uniref:Outer membrane murein-binding lipoprotein Lpp n=1 Tax=Nocardiopsis aegyptia TaxID=220378 RepID=A0A7Z0ENC8_9ACTN|nr:polysaccharide pyruvyl transferase family protein [Nocardiopsis aegyptia]NYJ34390.1 outer membrane murein-binding lipoprotein Lpp [Nocardiopsis aegyptia]